MTQNDEQNNGPSLLFRAWLAFYVIILASGYATLALPDEWFVTGIATWGCLAVGWIILHILFGGHGRG
jgi:hypothetical protein